MSHAELLYFLEWYYVWKAQLQGVDDTLSWSWHQYILTSGHMKHPENMMDDILIYTIRCCQQSDIVCLPFSTTQYVTWGEMHHPFLQNCLLLHISYVPFVWGHSLSTSAIGIDDWVQKSVSYQIPSGHRLWCQGITYDLRASPMISGHHLWCQGITYDVRASPMMSTSLPKSLPAYQLFETWQSKIQAGW
jgi:hypothetical protein